MKADNVRVDGYVIHDTQSLGGYLAGIDAVRARLGGGPASWAIEEVGDGNLNLVFLVHGPDGGVAVKQALPYVRAVAETWPHPVSRAHYERMVLQIQDRHVPGLVPSIIHADDSLALNVLELQSPHIVMRYGMIRGKRYPDAAMDVAIFSADLHFYTSDLALPAKDKRALITAFAGNTAMCKLVEDLVFTEPFTTAPNNRWTEGLGEDVAEIQGNSDLKLAACRLKLRYQSSAEALLHGDLHTGSIMVTETDTCIIDAEFAMMGPMGYDVGVLIANLLMCHLSQAGHGLNSGARQAYGEWILGETDRCWNAFRTRFEANWQQHGSDGVYPKALFTGTGSGQALAQERQHYLDRLFVDSLGFAGAEIFRRILGLAHNADFETIEDLAVRARCERRALALASHLMLRPADFGSIEAVTEASRRLARDLA